MTLPFDDRLPSLFFQPFFFSFISGRIPLGFLSLINLPCIVGEKSCGRGGLASSSNTERGGGGPFVFEVLGKDEVKGGGSPTSKITSTQKNHN